jgi:hypothetical protein
VQGWNTDRRGAPNATAALAGVGTLLTERRQLILRGRSSWRCGFSLSRSSAPRRPSFRESATNLSNSGALTEMSHHGCTRLLDMISAKAIAGVDRSSPEQSSGIRAEPDSHNVGTGSEDLP